MIEGLGEPASFPFSASLFLLKLFDVEGRHAKAVFFSEMVNCRRYIVNLQGSTMNRSYISEFSLPELDKPWQMLT